MKPLCKQQIQAVYGGGALVAITGVAVGAGIAGGYMAANVNGIAVGAEFIAQLTAFAHGAALTGGIVGVGLGSLYVAWAIESWVDSLENDPCPKSNNIYNPYLFDF